MIKLWRRLIEPVLTATGARCVVEIGAEAGVSTRVLLHYLKDKNGHLHSIDPVPAFDSDELLRQFPDTLTFHRELSLKVLPRLPKFDAVLVDGDHNWYTVFHELKEIERLHEGDPISFPVIFLHDTGWPYGRRDLYYNPDTIPAEFVQPHAMKGILPNKSELSDDGGMNMDLWNALHEGGPRNGVGTAVADYLAQTVLEFRSLHLPLYYGLTILVTHQRLAANAKLRAFIEDLDVSDGTRALMELNEHLRCVDGIYLQAICRRLEAAETRIRELEISTPKASQALPSAGDAL